MRSNPALYEMIAPSTLEEALTYLATQPGFWTPFAGGTDLMVLFEAGQLSQRNFLSLHHLADLRGITENDQEISIGALTTHTEMRNHPRLQQEFPNLCQAARETGAISIQNRGTLGGNIANASPAADSPPALLVYDAELECISQKGRRRIPYADFHVTYKKTLLRPDELIAKIILPKNILSKTPEPSYTLPPTLELRHYYRKVGTRKAQAITKVGLVGTLQVRADRGGQSGAQIEFVRIGLTSIAPIPFRATKTEKRILGEKITPALLREARATLAQEIKPIADIRSTGEYRLHVAQGLLEEMLLSRE